MNYLQMYPVFIPTDSGPTPPGTGEVFLSIMIILNLIILLFPIYVLIRRQVTQDFSYSVLEDTFYECEFRAFYSVFILIIDAFIFLCYLGCLLSNWLFHTNIKFL